MNEQRLSSFILVHSLAAAVADGTISEEAARAGLSHEDLHVLYDRYASAKVLVRLRSCVADGRMVFNIRELMAWAESNAEMNADGRT